MFNKRQKKIGHLKYASMLISNQVEITLYDKQIENIFGETEI